MPRTGRGRWGLRDDIRRGILESGDRQRPGLPEQLLEALDEFGAASASGGSREFARVLVESGRLTLFQADALLEGRLSQLFIGNYVILSRLGSGAMGTVFKARHRRMNRLVALKVFSGDSVGTTTLARRFQREVETIARLSHPNIVMAHDAGECEGQLYLVMELLDGHDLGVEVARNGSALAGGRVELYPAGRPAGWLALHGHGIIHRDVKPANLLRDSSGVVKVADLGLARPERLRRRGSRRLSDPGGQSARNRQLHGSRTGA